MTLSAYHQKASRPVPIRGQVYPSQAEAARALGVHRSTVNLAVKLGRADMIGRGRGWRKSTAGKE